MNLTFFVLLFLPLFHSPPPVSAQSIGCSVAGECAHSNVVGIVSTDSNYFCLESCQNTTACNFYTLYSSDEVCVLTSDCGSFETGTCLNCVSGESSCESYQCQVQAGCSGTAISHSGAVSTSECIANCAADATCRWWTYQADSSNCFLYEDCDHFFGCDSCTSGQSKCGDDLIAKTLLVLGGNRGGVYLDSVEAVSLTGESLQCPDFPALPNAVDGVTPTSIGPRDAPVLCGGLAEGEAYKDECFVYEPSSNSWKFLATMSEARTEYGIVQMEDNKFWVTGGFNGVSLAGTEFYDSSTGSFSMGPDMPTPTRRHSMMRINETHIVSVGNFNGSAPVNQVLLYDLVAEEWSDLPPMMTARFGLGLGMAQGRSGMSEMVVAGGPGQASTEIFNFQSQEWRAGGQLPRDILGCASVQVGSSFVMVGGKCSSCQEDQFTNSIVEYNPMTETWFDRPETIPTGRFRHSGMLVSDHIVTCSIQ